MIKIFCDKCEKELTTEEANLSQDVSSSDLCFDHRIEYEKENIELKPCPFCGQPAEMVRVGKNHQYFPRCTGGSGAMCPVNRYPHSETDGFLFEKDAIRVWNRRAVK
jgi:hypothetical protein